MAREHTLTDYEPVTPAPARGAVPSAVETWPAGAEVRAPEPAAVAAVVVAPTPLKRGHLLTFVGLFLFTVVLYLRPYELFDALSAYTSMAWWLALFTLAAYVPSQLALEGNLSVRPTELKLAALLCLAGLLSIPLALSPLEAWDTFNQSFIKAVLMFVVLINVVRTERRLRVLLWLTLAVSVAFSLSAVNDYVQGRLVLERVAGLVVGGMLGNPNDLALHLVTMLPLALALGLSSRHLLGKLVYLATAGIIVAGIVVSFSRGGFLGLLGVVCVLAWKFGRRRRLVVFTLLLLAAAALVVVAPGDYASRLGTIFNASADTTGSSTSRQALLLRSILVTLRHPLFGVGMGNFHTVSLNELVSHNAYTQVSAEMGIYAMVIYTLFIVTPLRRLRRIERATLSPRRGSRFYYLSVGLQASLIGYMISSFFASVAYLFYVYYLVGYAVCLQRLYAADAGTAAAAPAAAAAAAVAAAAVDDAAGARAPLASLT